MIKPLRNTLFALLLSAALIPLASAEEQASTTQNQLESESVLLENGVKLWTENKPDLAEAEFKKAIKSVTTQRNLTVPNNLLGKFWQFVIEKQLHCTS